MTLVETLAALVAGAVMVAFALRALGQLDELRRAEQRQLDRDVERDRALARLARDLEDVAHAAPARTPTSALVAIEAGAAPTLVLDDARVRWRVAAGHLYRGDALALPRTSEWRVFVWDTAAGSFVEQLAPASFSRDTLPLRIKLAVDGRSVERDLR